MKERKSALRPFLWKELPSLVFYYITIFMRFPDKYCIIYKEILLVIFVGYIMYLRYINFSLKENSESSNNARSTESNDADSIGAGH